MSANPPSSTEFDSLRQRVDALYTPLEDALVELEARRRRFAGRTPGHDWLPTGIPNHPQGFAFLQRHVATPSFETFRFLELAQQAGLLPVLGNFAEDKFCTKNPLKLALGRMGFHRGQNRHGHKLVEFLNVVHLDERSCRIGDLKTLWGQSLIEFHQELLAHALNGHGHPGGSGNNLLLVGHVTSRGDCVRKTAASGDAAYNRNTVTEGAHPFIHDYSAQCTRAGGCPSGLYREYVLRTCVADGILFEDYLLDEQELSFTRDVVLPAVDVVTAEFGLKLLIVRLTSPEDEASPHWLWYPGELKQYVKARLKKTATPAGEDLWANPD